jgi:hypothetical protein
VDAPHLSDDEIVDSAYYLLGDVSRMEDALLARRERWGLTYYVVNEWNVDPLAPLVARLAGR